MTLRSDDAATGGDGYPRPKPKAVNGTAAVLVVLLGLVLTLAWVGLLVWLVVRLAVGLLA